MAIPTVTWTKGQVRLIDQTKLPHTKEYLFCQTPKEMWHAIKRLSVRGAPAIGVAAAYGVLLTSEASSTNSIAQFKKEVLKTCDYLATSRPTAVNLFYALDRMKVVINSNPEADVKTLKKLLKAEAKAIDQEDKAVCRTMGRHGAALVKEGQNLLTVCNAGALATADYGTALGVMYAAKEAGKSFHVYSCETRPLLQGARLTVWELMNEKIPCTLICDNMAATLMKSGQVDIIFTGADRIAANGDAANKIGTYMLAVLAKHHGVPFYVVAPKSTFDLTLDNGDQIPIEERDASEVRGFGSALTAPNKVNVFNPAFDVTPASLITGIVTEYGVIEKPNKSKVKKVLG